mmetsp:Transcript_13495/g.25743  ORF Transcript_13495/g.25743 Transcript_13495/m.25743 type:complete len:281 (+) Transcript_13495:549-1391(+)
MSRNAKLGLSVHFGRAHLNLKRKLDASTGDLRSVVQALITIGFGIGDVILESFSICLGPLCPNQMLHVVAQHLFSSPSDLIGFIRLELAGCQNDAQCHSIVHMSNRKCSSTRVFAARASLSWRGRRLEKTLNSLIEHLAPKRVGFLDTRYYLECFQLSHECFIVVQDLSHMRLEIGRNGLHRFTRFAVEGRHSPILATILQTKGSLFDHGLEAVHSQSLCQRGVDTHGLAGRLHYQWTLFRKIIIILLFPQQTFQSIQTCHDTECQRSPIFLHANEVQIP